MEKALKTEDGLEEFGAVTDSVCEAALNLARAEAEPLAELFDASMRMTGDPVDGCVGRFVDRSAVC